MNVFLLAPILGCMTEVVRGEMSAAERIRGSYQALNQNMRKRKLSKV